MYVPSPYPVPIYHLQVTEERAVTMTGKLKQGGLQCSHNSTRT